MSVLGIDLGGTNVRAGLVRKGRLVRVEAVSIGSQGSQGEILKQIYQLVDPIVPSDLEGIGVGVPASSTLRQALCMMSRTFLLGKRYR